jgi:hypothetical protein
MFPGRALRLLLRVALCPQQLSRGEEFFKRAGVRRRWIPCEHEEVCGSAEFQSGEGTSTLANAGVCRYTGIHGSKAFAEVRAC